MELLGLFKGIYTTGLCRLKNCISTVPLLTALHKLPEMLCLLHFWIFQVDFYCSGNALKWYVNPLFNM